MKLEDALILLDTKSSLSLLNQLYTYSEKTVPLDIPILGCCYSSNNPFIYPELFVHLVSTQEGQLLERGFVIQVKITDELGKFPELIKIELVFEYYEPQKKFFPIDDDNYKGNFNFKGYDPREPELLIDDSKEGDPTLVIEGKYKEVRLSQQGFTVDELLDVTKLIPIDLELD